MIRGWSGSVDVFGSVLAGLLIGLGLDALFNTSPAFVVVLVVVGQWVRSSSHTATPSSSTAKSRKP